MINCPNCGSSDIYYEDAICVWQKADGEWELSDGETEAILYRDKSDVRFICNDCGEVFMQWEADKGSKEYKLRVSKIAYGTATIKADSKEAAIAKFYHDKVDVAYTDSEISDVTAERL